MNIEKLIHDLRARINPQYYDQIGTESYERHQVVKALDLLREENERLRKWIRVEGDHNDTCTRQILGETCQGCQCTHGEIDAARGAKPEPAP